MDTTQIVIVIVSISLTALIIVLGIQVWYILKEIRLSLQKINKMLDEAESVTSHLSKGVTNMAGFMNGLKTGVSLISSLRNKEETNE